jgi:hypothetical protein
MGRNTSDDLGGRIFSFFAVAYFLFLFCSHRVVCTDGFARFSQKLAQVKDSFH